MLYTGGAVIYEVIYLDIKINTCLSVALPDVQYIIYIYIYIYMTVFVCL